MTPQISDLYYVLAILALVLINGFFVASEFALVSIRRSRVEELSAQRVRGARAVKRAVRNLDRYIAGTQVGITIASLALGWVAEPSLVHLMEPLFNALPFTSPVLVHTAAVALAFAIITFLHVVLGELIPKTLALQSPEKVSLVVGTPMAFCVFLFHPLIWSLNGTGMWLIRKLGLGSTGHNANVHSVEELDIIVRQSHEAGVLDELERRLLQRSFSFSELVVSEVMIPRIDVEMVDIDQPVEQTVKQLAESIHTQHPVFQETQDNVIGMLLVHDVFKKTIAAGGNFSVRELLRPPLVVPENIRLDALLDRFRECRTHMALVVDEHGALAGLVSLKDLVEELFGEIPDVLEAGQPSIRKLDDGRVIIRGSVALHDINSVLRSKFEDDEVDTIAGFTVKRLGRIAKVGDSVDTPWGKIVVSDVTQLRITQVTLLPAPPAPETS